MMYDSYLVLNRRFFAALVVYISYTELVPPTYIRGVGAVRLALGLSFTVCYKETRNAHWPVMF